MDFVDILGQQAAATGDLGIVDLVVVVTEIPEFLGVLRGIELAGLPIHLGLVELVAGGGQVGEQPVFGVAANRVANSHAEGEVFDVLAQIEVEAVGVVVPILIARYTILRRR